MSAGYYLHFRLCPYFDSTFPAGKLDEVPDKDLSTALDDLARGWIEQNPEEVVALREATKPFILADNLGESDRIVLEESIDEFRWLTGTHPAQPLICRVAPFAGWGCPLPQLMFGGQVVSERCFFARTPNHTTAESAIEIIRRLTAESFEGGWMRPHLGYCAESHFTIAERKCIEITCDLIRLRADSFVQTARCVVDNVVKLEARLEELNQATYSRELLGNKIDDPTGPLTAAQIATILWGKAGEAEKTKALRWMKNEKLPATLADGLKDHYRVSKSQLELLEKAERFKRKESNS